MCDLHHHRGGNKKLEKGTFYFFDVDMRLSGMLAVLAKDVISR